MQASEERFRELYNTTPVMMHGVDGSGRIVSVNEHWLNTLGYARHEVVGRRAEEFMSAASRAQLDMDTKPLQAPGHPRENLLQMVAKSGENIDVIVSTRADVDNAGRLRGAKSSMVDVTERNRALRALEDSEMRYRAVVQDQTEIIARFNPQGRIDFANDACLRFLGRPADEVLGGNWLDVIDRSTEEPFDRGLRRLSQATPVGQWELRHVTPASRSMWCQWTVRAFFDRAGALVGYQAVGRDVTEIRKLEREIREISQREQERIGHDLHDGLGQELTGLSLMLKTLERDVQAQASSLLPEVRALSDTLNHSIATARSLAQGLSPVKLDHEGLVGALDHLVEHTANVYGIPIKLDAPRAVALQDPTMATDLYRIVQEAVTNAVRHGDPDSVQVTVKQEQGIVTLDVSDDGTGISVKASDNNGMGLRIMRYRANIIGAELEVGPRVEGGTLVRCTLRQSDVPEELKTA